MKENITSFIVLTVVAFVCCVLLSSCALKDCQRKNALQNEKQDIREDTDAVLGYRPASVF